MFCDSDDWLTTAFFQKLLGTTGSIFFYWFSSHHFWKTASWRSSNVLRWQTHFPEEHFSCHTMPQTILSILNVFKKAASKHFSGMSKNILCYFIHLDNFWKTSHIHTQWFVSVCLSVCLKSHQLYENTWKCNVVVCVYLWSRSRNEAQ